MDVKMYMRGAMAFVRSKYFNILTVGAVVIILFYTSTKELPVCKNIVLQEETSKNHGVLTSNIRKTTTEAKSGTTPLSNPEGTFQLPNDIKLKEYSRNSWIPEKFFTAPRYCNNFTYRFTIDHSEICKNKDVFIILAIRSAVSDVESRQLIRETWGKEDNIPGIVIIRLFLLGKFRNKNDKRNILKENEEHGDIIQADFIDNYDNLPLKSMMAFKWTRDFCAHARYFMISDMDMFIDIFKVTTYLRSIKSISDTAFTLCKVEWTEKPYRPRSRNKAAMSVSEYSTNEFSPYCWGGAYIATIPVINKLYLAGIHTPRIRIDDVWIGIVAARAGISFPPTSEAFIQPWNNRHNLLSHVKYFDGPLMFAAFHGAKDYVHQQIKSNWNRIIQHYKPTGAVQEETEMSYTTQMSRSRVRTAPRRSVHYHVIRNVKTGSAKTKTVDETFNDRSYKNDNDKLDDKESGKFIHFR